MDEATSREIRVLGETALVPLSRGQVAVIDASDVSLIAGRKWHAQRGPHTWYAAANETAPDGKRTLVRMHRLIIGAAPDVVVDHIDSNGLNCRRHNLRVATHAENMRNRRIGVNNTSGFKGVHWHRRKGQWMAQIRVDTRNVYLGMFTDPVEAHRAYCHAAVKYHGDFASFG